MVCCEMHVMKVRNQYAKYGASSINEFCENYDISRAFFYKLLKAGKGPDIMKVGNRTLVSFDAAERWCKQIEASSSNGSAE